MWNSLRKTAEPVFKQRFSFARKKGKSPSLFVENASLLLFSNYKSNFDLVEFELYKGKRRSLHLSKECYLAKINRPLIDFTTECFTEFYHHSIAQFNKAKEMRSDYTFRIQLKFGDSYFTNVPSIFENSSTLVYSELNKALKKGYKKFQFSYFSKKEKSCIFENTDDEDKKEAYLLDDNVSDINDKKKKKKKKQVKKANTAFDSNVNFDLRSFNFNSIFLENEFESKRSHTYIVYVELKNVKNQYKTMYRLKYGPDLEFVRMETLPIKWLNIDLRNLRSDTENRDIRFNLISEKTINLESESINDKSETNNLIKDGVIKIDKNENLILVDEFRSSSVFVRNSQSIKYYGEYENWKFFFDAAKIDLPDNISKELFKNFRICFSDSKEFSQPDNQGLFTVKTNRTEFSISSKIDVNSLKSSEINNLVLLCWYIIQAFSRILTWFSKIFIFNKDI